jgi:hypothetical protein
MINKETSCGRRGKTKVMFNFLYFFFVTTFFISNLNAVGKYVLASWRELGAHENPSRVIFVWVFDEQGNPMPNRRVYTSWGVEQKITDNRGFCEIELKPYEDRDVMIVDDIGSESDITPIMTVTREPLFGSYSYECIFLYKSDKNSPGIFDTSLVGSLNTQLEHDIDSPYTRSITYYWSDYVTAGMKEEYGGGGDKYVLGNWSGEVGQTFVAKGDRIWCVMFHGVIGDNNWLSWKAEILEDGPEGPPVGPPRESPHWAPILYPVVWPINNMPQTVPGKTYYLKITRPEGINYFRTVRDNYPFGCVYENKQPLVEFDMKAIVIEMYYGPKGAIMGVIKDISTSFPIDGVVVKIKQNNVEYTTFTDKNGVYRHMVPPGTYEITVSKVGYLPVTVSNITVSEGVTTRRDFKLQIAPSETPIVLSLKNRSFESGLSDWTQHPVQNTSYEEDASVAHSGTRSAKITCTSPTGAHLWQMTPDNSVTPGKFYKFWVWVKTENVQKHQEDAPGAALRIAWMTSSQYLRTDWIYGPVGTSTWTKVGAVIQAPSGAIRVQLALHLENATGSVWFDDVNIVEESTGPAPGGDTTQPPTPTLQTPPDGYTVTSLPYTFDWSDVDDNNTGGSNPCTYEIQISNDNSFSSPEVEQSGLTQSQYTLTSSIPNGRYYWRVRAKDNAGNWSAWSSTRTVIVNIVAPKPKPKIDKVEVVPNFVTKDNAKNVKIKYYYSSPGTITLRVYSIDGQLVKESTKYVQSEGSGEIPWPMQDDNGVELPSGIYVVYYYTATTTTPLIEKVVYVK